MLAINDATADAMLGTPDSDLWHNDMDNLLHNVNDLMRRLDQRQAEAGSEDADQEEDEGDGVFFAHEPGGAASPLPPAAGTYTETQVRCALAGCCAFRQHTTVVERAIFCCSCSVATVSRTLLAASPVCCARGFWPCMHNHDCKFFITPTADLVQVRSRQDSSGWQQWKEGPPSGQGWQVHCPLVTYLHFATILAPYDMSTYPLPGTHRTSTQL